MRIARPTACSLPSHLRRGLIAEWDFRASTGDKIFDSVSKQTATLVGGGTLSRESGPRGGAATTTGGQYLALPQSFALDIGGNSGNTRGASIEVWLNKKTSQAYGMPLSAYNPAPPYHGYAFTLGGAGGGDWAGYLALPSVNWANTTTTVADGQNVISAGSSVANQQIQAWTNGANRGWVSASSPPTPGTGKPNATYTLLSLAGSYQLNHYVSLIRLWNRPLTASEVRQLYVRGVSRASPLAPVRAPAVASSSSGAYYYANLIRRGAR